MWPLGRQAEEAIMYGFALAAILAAAATLATAAPALAHKDATDWLSMMQRDSKVRAQQLPAPIVQPPAAQPGWRYQGGPRGIVTPPAR
jgi:hypothetical protein